MLISENPPWWKAIKEDEDLYIEIRKENYIDVYYNGGGIVQNLLVRNGEFNGKIHFKYLLSNSSEYIDFNISSSDISLKKNSVKLISDFNSDSLKLIKNNIRNHYSKSSEKGIQADFILKSNFFIDSEFAYSHNNQLLRMDLVWLDVKKQRIVFVELKRQGDPRLDSYKIVNQLSKYKTFIEQNNSDLLSYYKELFLIKKDLGILNSHLSEIENLNEFTIETKPLLLFGDCTREWINEYSEWIDQKIRTIAFGAYYYGKPQYDCNLREKTENNRHVFNHE